MKCSKYFGAKWCGFIKSESIWRQKVRVVLRLKISGMIVVQIKTNIVSCHTADSKPVKQEVNSTVIIPPLVFPGHSVIFYDKLQALTGVSIKMNQNRERPSPSIITDFDWDVRVRFLNILEQIICSILSFCHSVALHYAECCGAIHKGFFTIFTSNCDKIYFTFKIEIRM